MSHRLDELVDDAARIVRTALDDEWLEGRRCVGRVVLFSGGNDSTTLLHLMTHVLPPELRATHTGHANTGIGAEATREFVRGISAAWGLPLIERASDTTYRDLVLEGGFPGAARHAIMYRQLKERALRKIRAELVGSARRERVLFIAGRRRGESQRRSSREIPEIELDRSYNSIEWVSPLVHWSDGDLADYRDEHEVPRNPVADAAGMSLECACGSFAEPGELDRIKAIDPALFEQIVALEAELHERPDVPEHRRHWGWHGWHDERPTRGRPQGWQTGPICSSCDGKLGELVERLPANPRLDDVIARGRARRAARGTL